jgi:hypothetical protein
MIHDRVRPAARVVAAGVLLGLASGFCGAGVITVAPTSQSAQASRDLEHTIQARQALLRDPDLAWLNVGVRVRNRVAVLWGPVPSVELGFKAEICVRGLIELREVRNQLFVNDDEAPSSNPPQASAPTLLPPVAPPILPGLPSDQVPGLPPSAPPAPAPTVEPPPPPAEEIELPPLRLPQPKTPAPPKG